MDKNEQQLHMPEKKIWTAPSLVTLDVRATMAADGLWQFAPEGDFWKRELLES